MVRGILWLAPRIIVSALTLFFALVAEQVAGKFDLPMYAFWGLLIAGVAVALGSGVIVERALTRQ